MITAQELLVIGKYKDRFCNLLMYAPEAQTAMIEFAKLHVIEELKKHIEHPTKPGYKRHDIVNRIKQLENE